MLYLLIWRGFRNWCLVEVVMIRKATVNDAEQLSVLNEEFNGKGETKNPFVTMNICLKLQKCM